MERDLLDASLAALSPDRRFATAYNAALQLATMVTACCGYRISARAHHQTTFEALAFALGHDTGDWVDYFDTCRRKRNVVDYDRSEA